MCKNVWTTWKRLGQDSLETYSLRILWMNNYCLLIHEKFPKSSSIFRNIDGGRVSKVKFVIVVSHALIRSSLELSLIAYLQGCTSRSWILKCQESKPSYSKSEGVALRWKYGPQLVLHSVKRVIALWSNVRTCLGSSINTSIGEFNWVVKLLSP